RRSDGRRQREQLVDGGRLVFLFRKPVAGCERPHFVGADPVDEAVELLADARLGARAVRRLEEHVYRAVEFLFCSLDVPLLELPLARLEVTIRRRDEREDRVFDGRRRDRRRRNGVSASLNGSLLRCNSGRFGFETLTAGRDEWKRGR